MTIGRKIIKSILRRSIRQSAGWTLFSFLVIACSQFSPVKYSHFENIGYDGLPEHMALDFSPIPNDSDNLSSEKFDAVLILRYTNKCPSRNVILNIEEFSLAHSIPDSMQTSVALFDPDGNPLGRGNYGVFEIADTLHKRISIPEGYTISVSSPLPQSATKGINAIGIVLSRSTDGNTTHSFFR